MFNVSDENPADRMQSSRGLTHSLKSSDARWEESFQAHREKESACTFCAPGFRLKTSDLSGADQTAIDELP